MKEEIHRKYILSRESEVKWNIGTGKSLLEALILAATNPQYDKILFIGLPVQYMKTTNSEHIVYLNLL